MPQVGVILNDALFKGYGYGGYGYGMVAMAVMVAMEMGMGTTMKGMESEE